jgi:hypothetical protein
MLKKLFWPFSLWVIGFSQTVQAGSATIPLNPMSALVSEGASIEFSSFSGPLHVPQNGAFAYGFNLPADYAINTPIRVVILWQTDPNDHLMDCQFSLASNGLFVTGQGESTVPKGDSGGGLAPFKASTPYTVNLPRGQINFQSPTPSNTTQKVVYKIMNSADRGVRKYKPGYAVNFSIFRPRTDSCAGDLIISGISLVYQTVPKYGSPPSRMERFIW